MSNFNWRMNSIDIKMEKANAIFRYRRLKKITTLFRYVEMFVFLILISRFSSQLPFAVRVSADHFRGISFAIFSPKFVFVIGNVIIVILLLKSRVVENGDSNEKIDVHDDYVKICEKSVVNSSSISTAAATEIVPSEEWKICRSRSENMLRLKCEDNQTRRKLRRSVTERRLLQKLDTAAQEKSYAAADELSGEEFRRTVEAFISRQQKSLRDEESTAMVYLGA